MRLLGHKYMSVHQSHAVFASLAQDIPRCRYLEMKELCMRKGNKYLRGNVS